MVKHEPVVNRARLLAGVRQAYGLPLVSLEFVPVGYASAVYLARTAGNIAYLLKMWPDVHTRREAVARLPLLRRLGDLDLGFSVPTPLSTVDGGLWSTFHGAPFAVFPFIDRSYAVG